MSASDRSGRRVTRHQLDVIATSVADVVSHAGGWLFDHSMAGWDVTVLVTGQRDDRPLRILGARAVDLETALGDPDRSPSALGVAIGLYVTDERVHHSVGRARDRAEPEIVLWGRRFPAELDQRANSVRHELSSAARAFKAQAMSAAGVAAESVALFETFRTLAHNIDPRADLKLAR